MLCRLFFVLVKDIRFDHFSGKESFILLFIRIYVMYLLCFSAGYVFAYNSQSYFTSIGQSKAEIAKFMGWIPLVGGSLGVLVGGFISDRVMNGRGIYARVAVTITSLVSPSKSIL